MTRHRILHLIKGLNRGGAETLLLRNLCHANRGLFDYRYGVLLAFHLPCLATIVGSAIKPPDRYNPTSRAACRAVSDTGCTCQVKRLASLVTG